MKLENRRKLVQVLLEKSRKSLAAATTLSKEGFTEAAISRAYYAAFYLAQVESYLQQWLTKSPKD